MAPLFYEPSSGLGEDLAVDVRICYVQYSTVSVSRAQASFF